MTTSATHVVTYDLDWVDGIESDTGDYAKVDAIMKSLGGRSAKTETTWLFDNPTKTRIELFRDVLTHLRDNRRQTNQQRRISANSIDIVVVHALARVVTNKRVKI